MELLIAIGKFIVAHAPELAGIILPPVVDLINRDVHSSEERYIVTLLVCLLTAVAFKWNDLLSGSVDGLLTSFTIIFAESQTIFKLYFKNSALRAGYLDRIIPEPTPATSQPVTP